jgi:hypothetical protein
MEADMRPVHPADLTNAAPVDGRNHGRTPAVRLVLDERNNLLAEITRRFYGGLSHRETAHRLRSRLLIYRNGPWRRTCSELTCPAAHRGRLDEMLWLLLRTSDRVPSIATIRRVLGVVVSHDK